MGIHFTDLLTAAEHQIAAARGADLKIELADRHRAEMAEILDRHAKEKEKNASDIDHARSSYQALISKIADDASATKKVVEEMVARQAALMIDVQVSIPALNIAGGSASADDGGEASPAEAAPATYTGKRRGRKSNAEKAAEAAAAAAAGAAAAPTVHNECDGEEGDDEAETGDRGSEDDQNGSLATTANDDHLTVATPAPQSTEALDGSNTSPAQELGEGDLETTSVAAVVVDALTETVVGEGEPALETRDGMVADAAEPGDESSEGAFAPTAETQDEASTDADDELDGFAALDALSTSTAAPADEEFEVPSFLRP